jgi:hypothetical protein
MVEATGSRELYDGKWTLSNVEPRNIVVSMIRFKLAYLYPPEVDFPGQSWFILWFGHSNFARFDRIAWIV